MPELPNHLAEMTRFSAATGLRQANATKLQWKQMCMERRHLWVAADQLRNDSAHAVPTHDSAVQVQLRLQGDCPINAFTDEDKTIV